MPAKVRGVTPDNKLVEFGTLTSSTSTKTETINVSTEQYFSQLTLSLYRYSSSYTEPYVYSFECTAGTLKIE
jgi:hypothetical protein